MPAITLVGEPISQPRPARRADPAQPAREPSARVQNRGSHRSHPKAAVITPEKAAKRGQPASWVEERDRLRAGFGSPAFFGPPALIVLSHAQGIANDMHTVCGR